MLAGKQDTAYIPGMRESLKETVDRLCRPLAPLPTGIEPRLVSMEGVRAVLFDIYGTLLISGSGDVGTAMQRSRDDALLAALDSAGVAADADSGMNPTARGLLGIIKARQECARQAGVDCPEVDMREVWRDFLSENNLVEDNSRLDSKTVDRLGLEYECRVNPVWPMPGWRECLQELGEFRLGIVSNAQFYTPIIMSRLLPGFPERLGFDTEVISYSYQILQSKPATAIFAKPLAALERIYGISPAETAYIGNDMLNDVWTASRLGIRTILFAGDRRSLRLREEDQRCRNLSPDAVVNDLAQIPELLRA